MARLSSNHKPRQKRFRKRTPFRAKWKLGVRTPFGSINYDSKKLKSVIKRVELKNAENKLYAFQCDLATTTHQTIYTLGLNTAMIQGFGSNNFEGRQIYLNNFRIRMHYFNNQSDSSMYGRLIICKATEEYAGASVAWSSISRFNSSIFINPSDYLTAFVDYKHITVISDQVIKCPQHVITSQVNSMFTEVDIPVNKQIKFRYDAAVSANTFAKEDNFYAIWIPYVEGGTIGTTAAGGFQMQLMTSYKDI